MYCRETSDKMYEHFPVSKRRDEREDQPSPNPLHTQTASGAFLFFSFGGETPPLNLKLNRQRIGDELAYKCWRRLVHRQLLKGVTFVATAAQR